MEEKARVGMFKKFVVFFLFFYYYFFQSFKRQSANLDRHISIVNIVITMYLPIVEPRQCPGLWKQSNSRAHTLKLKPSSQATHSSVNNVRDLFNAPNGYQNITVDNEEIGFNIDDQEKRYNQRIQQIRMHGWEYLRPHGIGKTMQQIFEEQEDFTDHEVDDEEAIEDHLMHQEPEESLFDLNNTTGGIVEPVRIERTQDLTRVGENTTDAAEQTQTAIDLENIMGENSDREEEEEEEELDEDGGEEVDLDADIAEAEEANYSDYDDDYNENEYDEGFMAEEEYDDENELNRQVPQVPVPAPTNSNVLQHIAEPEQNLNMDNTSNNNNNMEEDEDEEELVFTYEPLKADENEPVVNTTVVQAEGNDDDEDDGEGDMSF